MQHFTSALMQQIFSDPERAPMCGARPVVSLSPDDEQDYRNEVAHLSRTRCELERRGRSSGCAIELEFEPEVVLSPECAQLCWAQADPFVISEAATEAASDVETQWAQLPEQWRTRGADTKREAQCWEAWLRGCTQEQLEREHSLCDSERDVCKLRSSATASWAKLARLSTYKADDSRRLCFGAGVERVDDNDPKLACAAWTWATQLLPELKTAMSTQVRKWLQVASHEHLRPSNPIVYWNRPGGGALFHHDVLDSFTASNSHRDGQVGVVFVQGAGTTVWIALSSTALEQRCREFVQDMLEGGAPWLLANWAGAGLWSPLRAAALDPRHFQAAIARADSGALRPLLHGSPEFTGYLIDSGHAAVLHPGDAIVLPNHGLSRTAMHSVYCGSAGPNVGISIGLRGTLAAP